jgi:hypothetical protein
MDNSTTGYFDDFTTDGYGHNDYEEYQDPTFLLNFYHVSIGLSCVGVLGNGVAFWVWLGEKRKSTTTLLFMYLAVCDNLVLISPLDKAGLHPHTDVYYIFWSLSRLALTLSAHITAIITFNRWLAVWKPLRVSTIMSKRRVVTVNAVTFL